MSSRNRLTPYVVERIVIAIELGNYMETAAAFAGVDRTHFHDWLKRGRHGIENGSTTTFTKFVEEIDKAIAKAEMDHVEILNKASKKNWNAAGWWLERRYPARWGRKARTSGEEAPGKSISELIEEAAKRRAAQILKDSKKPKAEKGSNATVG